MVLKSMTLVQKGQGAYGVKDLWKRRLEWKRRGVKHGESGVYFNG